MCDPTDIFAPRRKSTGTQGVQGRFALPTSNFLYPQSRRRRRIERYYPASKNVCSHGHFCAAPKKHRHARRAGAMRPPFLTFYLQSRRRRRVERYYPASKNVCLHGHFCAALKKRRHARCAGARFFRLLTFLSAKQTKTSGRVILSRKQKCVLARTFLCRAERSTRTKCAEGTFCPLEVLLAKLLVRIITRPPSFDKPGGAFCIHFYPKKKYAAIPYPLRRRCPAPHSCPGQTRDRRHTSSVLQSRTLGSHHTPALPYGQNRLCCPHLPA